MNVSIRFIQAVLLAALTVSMAACSEVQLGSHYAKKLGSPDTGTYKVGNPYQAGGVWYYPKEDFTLSETGIASWYGPDFHGKNTANGERYDQNELTAAHRTLPMPSLVRVTNLENGRAVVVRINDRGPFARGRIIDVSKRAADLLGFIGTGTARVRIDVMEKESRQIAEAARRGMDVSRITPEDLNRISPQPEPPRATYIPASSGVTPSQMASLNNDATMMPDSLKTPTITVEELSSPGGRPSMRETAPAPAPVSGHMDKGKFMPDPIVSQVPVQPTGIFVQAGAFSVKENAERLKTKFAGMAPVTITPVTAGGRTLYRVKLGPISSVDKADQILSQVVKAGNGTARVVHEN